MKNRFSLFFVLALVISLASAGCATTTRARKTDAADASAQVADLQSQLKAKDQQIQDLQYQLDSYQQSLPSTNFSKGAKSIYIKAAGVSVMDVQKALAREGYDPGPVDGRMGKKTKSAIKEFQRKNHLKADGVVGEKTWSLLKG